MASKSFRVQTESAPNIPFDITLVGEVDLDTTEATETVEKFHARPKVPGALILDVAAAGAAGPSYQAASLRRFFTQAVIPEDRDRFIKLLDESDPPISIATLTEIADWLMEQYSEQSPQ